MMWNKGSGGSANQDDARCLLRLVEPETTGLACVVEVVAPKMTAEWV
jgi:hypothetical protein